MKRYRIVHKVVANVKLDTAPGTTREGAEARAKQMIEEMRGNGVPILESQVEEWEDAS